MRFCMFRAVVAGLVFFGWCFCWGSWKEGCVPAVQAVGDGGCAGLLVVGVRDAVLLMAEWRCRGVRARRRGSWRPCSLVRGGFCSLGIYLLPSRSCGGRCPRIWRFLLPVLLSTLSCRTSPGLISPTRIPLLKFRHCLSAPGVVCPSGERGVSAPGIRWGACW